MARHDLSDEEWARLSLHLPSQAGRLRRDDRAVLNGIVWILGTGAPWRDLPERYGPWKTVASRFHRRCKLGVWARIFEGIRADAGVGGAIDWEIHFVDGSVVRAHQHAAGTRRDGEKGGAARRSAGAAVASRPRSTCARMAVAVPWSSR